MGDLIPLSNAEYSIMLGIEQIFGVAGVFPTVEQLVEKGFGRGVVERAFAKPNFVAACEERGLRWPGSQLAAMGLLTEKQMVCANTMLDFRDTRSDKKKLSELGIPTQVYNNWLRDPGYQAYVKSRAQNMLGDNEHEADVALISKVRAGDLSAIKYYNEMRNKYVELGTRSAAASAQANFDISQLLVQILDIIQRHVPDDAAKRNIADEILVIAGEVVKETPKELPQTPLNTPLNSVRAGLSEYQQTYAEL